MVRIVVLSDVCLYREGLARLLEGEPDFGSVSTAATVEEGLRMLTGAPADVVLLDLGLPEALHGARALATRFPGLRLVALGLQDDQGDLLACAEAGILGFVSRSGSRADLVEAIRCAGTGELACSKRVAGALIRRVASLAGSGSASPLTPRQAQIVRLVDEGLSNKEIAARLHISTATARNHVHVILGKLGARSRTEAAAVARRSLSRA
jgi:DNA-binding NarL/FixJ family response regulator